MDIVDRVLEEVGIKYETPDDIDWYYICKYTKVSENFIREFKDKIKDNWHLISQHQNLSENFIREFNDDVNWYNISMHQKLSENFIREFKDRVNWTNISKFQFLSENFIREFKNEVDWFKISRCQKLSEDFINEFNDKVFSLYIYESQKLSEDFIKKHEIDDDFYYISKYQKLSESFIKNNLLCMVFKSVKEYQKLSPDFIKEFNLVIDEDNWLYKNTEFKKNKVIETKLYECYDDYFIAYKSIRQDRYSVYNFQYQYLKGETYECHCDCTNAENSFGLSAWTEGMAKMYYEDGIIIKLKIKYEDVGRVIPYGGKIRCFKFEVLD